MLSVIKSYISFGLITMTILFALLAGNATNLQAEIIYTPEGVVITHYPEHFDLTGNIDRIDENGIVVHDRYFVFAPNAKFMTPQTAHSSVRYFKVGQEVSLRLNKKRQVSILCINFQE